VLADQLGLPLPSLPVVLAAGVMAGTGTLNLAAVLTLAALAAFLSDALWFEIGRRKGGSVLKFACRASLEPVSCVRRAKNMFAHRSRWTLLMSKFVPGLNVVASPLAGMSTMGRGEFQILNGLGALLFALALVLPGYWLSTQLEPFLALAAKSGQWLTTACLLAFGGYLTLKYLRRAHFIRRLRLARISPEELLAKLDGGTRPAILDLRHPLDFEVSPQTLPGAIRLAPEELSDRHHEIPRDREIVLYCTCPDEYTSARAALLLQQYGLTEVRPLAGGFDGWVRKGFPLILAAPASSN
jgi:membrane protein DedA with SNARE-associated domain/rhodanese-related sulfurtransferase